MRQIVTHKSCDIDAISSVWLLKRFYPNWDGAEVGFVNAGEKLTGVYENENEAIELVDGVETIHVDTGMGALDHHQTADNNVCGASKTLDFILANPDSNLNVHETKREAVKRIVELVIDDDHFQEVYYPDSNHDIYEFGIVAIIQGYKLIHQKDDSALVEFIFQTLDAVLQNLEKKIWAEQEIKEKGIEFESKWGRAMGIESINDEVLKTAQMMGYKITLRKDPNEGFVRIKAMPNIRSKNYELRIKSDEEKKDQELTRTIDLTEAYEKLKELDPTASWFLHASKRMLLNGSSKNPEMKGSSLTLEQVIGVLNA
ncbi:MAG: hypothetical protein Q7T54_02560 [Candidatus Levybacteria bacterium]|nr:hypothetical protein [Candidatus Levybacteria bacterium]